jgi:hypothetical protein
VNRGTPSRRDCSEQKEKPTSPADFPTGSDVGPMETIVMIPQPNTTSSRPFRLLRQIEVTFGTGAPLVIDRLLANHRLQRYTDGVAFVPDGEVRR